MNVKENLISNLTVSDSDDEIGQLIVSDNDTGETGNVVANTYAGKMLIQWQNFIKSDNHDEFELILLSAPNVTSIFNNDSEDAGLKSNPFNFFGVKKQFYVNFWEGAGNDEDEYHQTVITARNKNAAIKIAKRGYKNFTLDSIEEI